MPKRRRLTVMQCKSCPWKTSTNPMRDIPNYRPDLACGLRATIATSPEGSIRSLRGDRKVMACHYSTDDKMVHCAGWLHNQLGPGNNIGVRLGMMNGSLPIPKVRGPQHDTYEDTLPEELR